MSEQIRPERGSWWKHYKSGIYFVIEIARLERDGDQGEEMVLYVSRQDGRKWIRSMSEWMSTVGGVPRYESIPPPGPDAAWELGARSVRLEVQGFVPKHFKNKPFDNDEEPVAFGVNPDEEVQANG